MIGPEANSEAYALYENTIKASPFRPQGFLWVGKERLFLLHLPLSKRDARPLAPQGEEALLRKPSAAAQGLRVCARWAFRPVSAGSKQSAGLPLVDLAGFDLPAASDLPTASRRRRSLTSFQTEIWRQSTASRLCFLRRRFKVKTLGTLSPNLCHLCKGGRNF